MKPLKCGENKLPLGKLSKTTIQQGYLVLKEIGEALAKPARTKQNNADKLQVLCELSDRYYSLIPHALGRGRPAVIDDDEKLEQEIELMGTLTNLKVSSCMSSDSETALT